MDGYKRELERYGGNNIELSEQLFRHNSSLVLSLLEEIGEQERWKIAIYMVNHFVKLFYPDIESRMHFYESNFTSFGKEFGIRHNKNLKVQLDRKYREYQKELHKICFGDTLPIALIDTLKVHFDRYECSISPIRDKIVHLSTKGKLHVPLRALISSHVHMNLNRLFISKPRLQEFAVYSLLFKLFRSNVARRRNMNHPVKELEV